MPQTQHRWEAAKWLAVLCMVANHSALALGMPWQDWGILMGRVSLPTFALIIVLRLESDTEARATRYLGHLLLWALIAQPVYALLFNHGYLWRLNALFTLACGVTLIFVARRFGWMAALAASAVVVTQSPWLEGGGVDTTGAIGRVGFGAPVARGCSWRRGRCSRCSSRIRGQCTGVRVVESAGNRGGLWNRGAVCPVAPAIGCHPAYARPDLLRHISTPLGRYLRVAWSCVTAGGASSWCPGPDSNRHALRRGILSPLRLPISPPGQMARERSPKLWHSGGMEYPTLEQVVGHTPLVRLQRLGAAECATRGNVILGKLEGHNPAGSVKDRPALAMITGAEARGEIRPGDTLIEATSGNTGIALAMAAAIKGYRMLLIMPEDLSVERAQTMKAFGAELILTPKSGGMEYARDLATQMEQSGKGRVLDQFANADNPRVHYETTGPELWQQTGGRITHFVSAMGTTGTITGVSRFLKEKNPAIRVIGAQPSEGSRIPGIRKWPQAYLPKIYDPSVVDELVYVSQADAEGLCRSLAREEGIFAGISAAGACWVAQQVAAQVRDATIVFVVCDRGERYLSTGVFPA